MPDYGHELEFGVFLTPSAANAEEVVALARLADSVGLDLVAFQDHPYQPRFLDTWTLLAFVAARTERIQLATDVLNLPLRPPAMVARAAASLDVLTGGRVELGLGAGASWDAIEAMGGRRLSPGERVDALDEAIDVIRSIWEVERQDRVDYDGSHYGLHGAARGPAPRHRMQIWVGDRRRAHRARARGRYRDIRHDRRRRRRDPSARGNGGAGGARAGRRRTVTPPVDPRAAAIVEGK